MFAAIHLFLHMLTWLDHLFTHQKLINVVFDEHLLLNMIRDLLNKLLLTLRINIWNLLYSWLLLLLLLKLQVITDLNLRLLFLNPEVNFLYFIWMSPKFVTWLFNEAPVLICFIKFKIFIYVITHLILLFIFFLNIRATLTNHRLLLLLARQNRSILSLVISLAQYLAGL